MKKRNNISFLSVLFVLLGFAELAQAHYSPQLGRFLSRDPIEERGGVNVHAFVRNNPTNTFDKLGLIVVESWNSAPPAQLGGWIGRTNIRPRRNSEVKIEESEDKLCAWVEKPADIDILVDVTMIDDPLGHFTTTTGYIASSEHEARRVSVARVGYGGTLGVVENELSTKCGVVKRDAPGEAKQALEKYIRSIQGEAFDKFYEFYDYHNSFIDNENFESNQIPS